MSAHISGKELRRVVIAASVGNIIEWYDFYIFGSLASILAVKFFDKTHPVAAFLSTVAIFSVGFLIRPLGAFVFGWLGDKVGRKYTFLVTLSGMGLSTAVIGRPHEIKGQAIAAFVTIKDGAQGTKELMEELKGHVAKKIGALARPDDLIFASDLPKTRSGKIMRRLLRDIAEGRALGDTTTLADPAVVASLKTKYEEQES